jgi:hypothetical protein
VIESSEQPDAEPALRIGKPNPAGASRLSRWISSIGICFSLALLVGAVICFIARWDAVAAVTQPPFWLWGTVGLVLTGAAWRLGGGFRAKLLLATWAVATLAFSDDLYCLALSPLRALAATSTPEHVRPIRVVSLNCASQAKAAEETRVWEPDIVLLQESPSSNDVARLCREWFGTNGAFLYGLDCSIISRGALKPVANPRSLRFVWGRVQLPGRSPLDVVSLRLLPPDIRLDLWSPGCWEQHTHSRKIRRSQLQEVVQALRPELGRGPMIVGGDFNAPAGDAIFELLRLSLKDCFREAGRGWGNTAINTIPVSRPDQVWINRASVPVRAWAKTTDKSDHRMVIADIVPE